MPTRPAPSTPPGERAYRLVFENAPPGLFHFDTTPTLIACNDSFARLIGSSKRMLIGLNLLTLQDEALIACATTSSPSPRTS